MGGKGSRRRRSVNLCSCTCPARRYHDHKTVLTATSWSAVCEAIHSTAEQLLCWCSEPAHAASQDGLPRLWQAIICCETSRTLGPHVATLSPSPPAWPLQAAQVSQRSAEATLAAAAWGAAASDIPHDIHTPYSAHSRRLRRSPHTAVRLLARCAAKTTPAASADGAAATLRGRDLRYPRGLVSNS